MASFGTAPRGTCTHATGERSRGRGRAAKSRLRQASSGARHLAEIMDGDNEGVVKVSIGTPIGQGVVRRRLALAVP